MIYNDQLPFGLKPLNVARLVAYGAGGVNAGGNGGVASAKEVGRYVPEVNCVNWGKNAPAASSKVNETWFTVISAPHLDRISDF